jgi:uncharacterized Tic20 family protein
MLIHLSQLLALAVPLLGFIVPIVLWAIKKDDDPSRDRHGRIVINWIISVFIYTVLIVTLVLGVAFCVVLSTESVALMTTIVVPGIMVSSFFTVILIVFPIIGGIKANDGIEWKYPMSIQFFK